MMEEKVQRDLEMQEERRSEMEGCWISMPR